MPRPRKGKLLGGSSSHEDQIIGNLIASLIEFEKIETTLTKAKVTKPYVDKVITKAKKGSLHDRRQVLKFIQNKAVVAKLFDELGPKYQDRDGGYTRITRAGYRKGDGAELARIELVRESNPVDNSTDSEESNKITDPSNGSD